MQTVRCASIGQPAGIVTERPDDGRVAVQRHAPAKGQRRRRRFRLQGRLVRPCAGFAPVDVRRAHILHARAIDTVGAYDHPIAAGGEAAAEGITCDTRGSKNS